MNKEFEVYTLNEQGKQKAREISQAFDELLTKLLVINASRSDEMSLVRTKLEEGCFFAKKAMASQLSNKETS